MNDIPHMRNLKLRAPSSPLSPLASAGPFDVAYQPIISMSSLRTQGFEALTRMGECSPYTDVLSLLDASAADGSLRQTEQALLTKAITKFARFSGAREARLFCNVDNRVFDDERTSPEVIVALVRNCGLMPANLCIELSERQPPSSADAMQRLVDVFLNHNVRIAIDDFGQGFSGLNTLMQINPHYVKIDRAFVSGVAASPKQQAIVSSIVALSHSLGYLVVAEGVESESDFRALRGMGCDMAQGYLIARPDPDLVNLRMVYTEVVSSSSSIDLISPQVSEMMLEVAPLHIDDPLELAVDRFKQENPVNFIPVTDHHGYVHGALYESDLRYYLFGDYGSALLANKGMGHNLERFVRRCPISEASATTHALIASYVVAETNDGVVLTLDGRYIGVLRNQSILRLAAERDVADARDQNPLTFLPGNTSINRHLYETLNSSHDQTIVFFDFDHFKAFNDCYGFSCGDRAILMFAESLMKFRHKHDAFVAHIGGDDFFASIPQSGQSSRALVAELIEKFRTDVESLYLVEDRARGGLWAKDRFGQSRFLPLLRASAAVLPLPSSRSHISVDEIVSTLARGKSQAKKASDSIAVVDLPSTAVSQQINALAERMTG